MLEDSWNVALYVPFGEPVSIYLNFGAVKAESDDGWWHHIIVDPRLPYLGHAFLEATPETSPADADLEVAVWIFTFLRCLWYKGYYWCRLVSYFYVDIVGYIYILSLYKCMCQIIHGFFWFVENVWLCKYNDHLCMCPWSDCGNKKRGPACHDFPGRWIDTEMLEVHRTWNTSDV